METETREQTLIKCRRAAVGAAAVAVAVAGLFLFRGRDKLATTTAGQTAGWIRQCLPFAAGNEPGMRRCCRCCKLLLLLLLWLLLLLSSRLSTGSNNWAVYRWMDCLAAPTVSVSRCTWPAQRNIAFSCERLFKDIAQILETRQGQQQQQQQEREQERE